MTPTSLPTPARGRPPSPPTPSDRQDLLWACAIVAAAAALRLPGLGLAPIEDELTLLGPVGLLEVLRAPESAINPPLQRLLLAPLAPGPGLLLGRVVSFVASSLAPGLLFLLVRRLGGDRVGAVLVGAWWATEPQAIDHGAFTRAYAPWSLAFLVHLHGLARLVPQGAHARGALAAALGGAAAMVWLHYLSVPILVGEALTLALLRAIPLRRGLAVFGGAAALALPLVVLVLSIERRYLGSASGGPLAAVRLLLGLGYAPVAVPGAAGLGRIDVPWILLLLQLAAWSAWPRWSAPSRAVIPALAGAQLALAGAVAGFDGVQSIRPPAAQLGFALMAPGVALCAQAVPGRLAALRALPYALVALVAFGASTNVRDSHRRARALRAAESPALRAVLLDPGLPVDTPVHVDGPLRLQQLEILFPGARRGAAPVAEDRRPTFRSVRVERPDGTLRIDHTRETDPPRAGLWLTWDDRPLPGCEDRGTAGTARVAWCP